MYKIKMLAELVIGESLVPGLPMAALLYLTW